jgi:hypothetical protein
MNVVEICPRMFVPGCVHTFSVLSSHINLSLYLPFYFASAAALNQVNPPLGEQLV